MRAYCIRLLIAAVLCFSLDVTFGARGTTPNIRDIFIGRCFDYQEIGPGRNFDLEPKDCVAIWEALFGAWGLKNPRDVTLDDYTEFFDLTRQSRLPENKTLLWSGTYDIAHAYANGGKRYVTLEDTLIGYLANGLTWCGVKCDDCTGINYDTCPEFHELPLAARQAFWGGASATFASSAKGLVSIMVNGSNPSQPAFRNDSFMALFEIPDLSKLVNIRVVLVHDLDKIPLESCSTGSMVAMRHAIQGHGFTYVCQENPLDVLHLMCEDHVQDRRCMLPPLSPDGGRGDGLGTKWLRGVLNIPTTRKTDLVG